MVRVLCVSYPQGKKVFGKSEVKIEKIDQEQDEMVGGKYDWVAKALKTMKTPMGQELKPCPWHSGSRCYVAGDNNNPDKCYIENPPDFGIWTTDYNVCDTCHIQIRLDKEREEKDIRRMEALCDSYNKWYHNAMNSHREFMDMIEKRDKMVENIKILNKMIETNTKEPDLNNPQYRTLVQLRDREQQRLEKKIENMRKVYSESKNDTSLEDFVKKYTTEERDSYEKAKNAVTSWYNSKKVNAVSEVAAKLEAEKRNLETTNKMIESSYKIPFTYVFRALENLEAISSYVSRYKIRKDFTKEELKNDILSVRIMLSGYNSLLKGKNPIDVVTETEKEQQDAIRFEKEQKNCSTIYKVKNSGGLVPIIQADGSIKYEEASERFVIGAMGTMGWKEAEAEKWGKLRR